MLTESGGQYAVKLHEILGEMVFEVMNPDLHLFTVTKPMKKKIVVKISVGRGYVPSERHEIENKVVDEIVVDSAFSPIKLVNYFVENTRVGQDTDFDRLVMEVTTDGRINTPMKPLHLQHK